MELNCIRKYHSANLALLAILALFHTNCETARATENSAPYWQEIESLIEVTFDRTTLLDDESDSSEYDQNFETTIDLAWSNFWQNGLSFVTSISLESTAFKSPDNLYWEDEWFVALSDTYLSFTPPFAPNHEISIGRQGLSDSQQWWWDTTVDAIALRGETERSSYFLGAGTSNTDITTSRDTQDPEESDVLWLFSSATVNLFENTDITGFLLRELDRSDTPDIGDLVDSETVDEEDRALTWHGFRFENESTSTPIGVMFGSFNGSFVHGSERVLTLEDEESDDSNLVGQRVVSIQDVSVSGWAIDTTATLVLPIANEPEVTFSYATGSGTNGWQPNTSRSFRQVGSQTYGELYSPELTNIEISSLGISLPINDVVSAELVHYHFAKRSINDGIGETGIDIDPTNMSSLDLGSETVMSLFFEPLDQVQLGLIWSIFKPGRAYARDVGNATLLGLDIYIAY